MNNYKFALISLLATALAFTSVSCSTADLGGSVPLPFTEPSTSAQLDLELRPMPPRFCIGLDLVPTVAGDESGASETATK